MLSESGIMLPAGFKDRDAVGGGGASWSIVGFDHHEITATPWDMTIPTDTEAGDLILAFTGGRDGAATFTQANTYTSLWNLGTGGNVRTQGLYRYAGASEGDTTEEWTTSNPSREQEVALVVLRGGPGSGDPTDTTVASSFAYDITPEVPAITTLTDNVMLFGVYGRRWNASSDTEDEGYPSGFTGILRRYLNPSQLGVCYKVVPTAGVVAAVDWGDDPVGETNAHYDIALAIKAG